VSELHKAAADVDGLHHRLAEALGRCGLPGGGCLPSDRLEAIRMRLLDAQQIARDLTSALGVLVVELDAIDQ
jgi:hypothetical protein